MIGSLRENPQHWYEVNKLTPPEERPSEEAKTAS